MNAQLTGKMNSIGKKDFPEASPDQNVTIFSSWRAMRTNGMLILTLLPR